MTTPSGEPGRFPIPYRFGPHDGDTFRASPTSAPPERIARSHRTGAGSVRSIYALKWCICHGTHYRYLSEELLV